MNLIRWEPFTDMVNLRQAMDNLFEDRFFQHYHPAYIFSDSATPTIDMYETDSEIVVKAALPGVEPEETNIDITGNILTIKGDTKVEQEIKEENYIHREYRHGSFNRSLALPSGLSTEKAEANMENGILTLSIPKAEEVKPKVIKVKTNQIDKGKKAKSQS